jgi:hypothetical protein
MTNTERCDKRVSEKINDEIKKFEKLEKCFTKIYELEKNLKEKRIQAFELLGKEDENVFLQNIYSNFKKNMIELEEKGRELKQQKLEKTILPAIKYYPTKIHEFRTPINKLKDFNKRLDKAEKNINTAVKDGNLDQKAKHELDQKSARTEKINEGNKLESNILEFEANRINDNKNLLLHYVHSEISFHANALQQMSKLYQEITLVEPKEKLKDFIALYNLNSMKEYNLEDKFNFKDGTTEKNQQMHRRKTLQSKELGNEGSKNFYLIINFYKKKLLIFNIQIIIIN